MVHKNNSSKRNLTFCFFQQPPDPSHLPGIPTTSYFGDVYHQSPRSLGKKSGQHFNFLLLLCFYTFNQSIISIYFLKVSGIYCFLSIPIAHSSLGLYPSAFSFRKLFFLNC